LVPPNKEVEDSLEALFDLKFDQSFGASQMIQSVKALVEGDVQFFQEKFNENLPSIVSVRDSAENFHHGLLIGLLWFMRDRFSVKSQPESGDGYPDLILTPKLDRGRTGLVLEFKKVYDPPKDEDKAETKVLSKFKEAFRQINGQKYETALRENEIVKDVLKYAFVFIGKKCHILLQVNGEPLLKRGDGTTLSLDDLLASRLSTRSNSH
jgi:hypothetical protein